jgi:enoyl-CoA hydratase/carnithine racemase
MGTDYATIRYEDDAPPVARITLNRPDKRNPISPLTVGELIHALEAAGASEAIRVVVLTGAGEAFSAGGDLGAMSGAAGGAESPARPASLIGLFPAMHRLGKPIVAMVNGHALAGGLGLMVACDLAVASEAATFGLTEIKVGLWPMMITAELVRNIGRKRTLELMLTGRRVDAAEALALGLVNRVVAADALEAETLALARELAARSPAAMALGLRAFYDTQDLAFEPALSHLEGELGKVLALDDAREGIMAFLQKREPTWTGR